MSEIQQYLQTTSKTVPMGTVETNSSGNSIVRDQFGRPQGTVTLDGDIILGDQMIGFVDLTSGHVFFGSRSNPGNLMGSVESSGWILDKKGQQIAVLVSEPSTLSNPERRNREASGGLLLRQVHFLEAFGKLDD